MYVCSFVTVASECRDGNDAMKCASGCCRFNLLCKRVACGGWMLFLWSKEECCRGQAGYTHVFVCCA